MQQNGREGRSLEIWKNAGLLVMFSMCVSKPRVVSKITLRLCFLSILRGCKKKKRDGQVNVRDIAECGWGGNNNSLSFILEVIAGHPRIYIMLSVSQVGWWQGVLGLMCM